MRIAVNLFNYLSFYSEDQQSTYIKYQYCIVCTPIIGEVNKHHLQ